jgi:hypothetical protein
VRVVSVRNGMASARRGAPAAAAARSHCPAPRRRPRRAAPRPGTLTFGRGASPLTPGAPRGGRAGPRRGHGGGTTAASGSGGGPDWGFNAPAPAAPQFIRAPPWLPPLPDPSPCLHPLPISPSRGPPASQRRPRARACGLGKTKRVDGQLGGAPKRNGRCARGRGLCCCWGGLGLCRPSGGRVPPAAVERMDGAAAAGGRGWGLALPPRARRAAAQAQARAALSRPPACLTGSTFFARITAQARTHRRAPPAARRACTRLDFYSRTRGQRVRARAAASRGSRARRPPPPAGYRSAVHTLDGSWKNAPAARVARAATSASPSPRAAATADSTCGSRHGSLRWGRALDGFMLRGTR